MKTWMRRRLNERRQDERGAILILSAVFLVVMVLAAALALDIGLEGVDKRADHKVADLASLDAARALNNTVVPCVDAARFAAATLAANQSAIRNGFDPLASGNHLSLDVGTWNPTTKTYTPVNPGVACTADAVHVVVNSVTHFKFQPASQNLSAEAYAAQNLGVVNPQPPPPPPSTDLGAFKLGSFLATVDSTQAALLNDIVCQALTGVSLPNVGAVPVSCPKFNLSAASWQGLGNANITMDELGKALAANGVIASPDQVGGATVQADQLFKASGDALTKKGDTADATIMYNLAQGASGHPDPVVIPALAPQVQGQQGSAIAATQPVNVGNLVIGAATAQVSNGSNALAVPNTGITVPGVSSAGLNLAVIQGPIQWGPGPAVSPWITTAQLSAQTSTKSGLVLQLNNLPVSIPGLPVATLSGSVSVSLTGAVAKAQMTAVNCSTNTLDMAADPQPYHTSVQGNALTLSIPLLVPVDLGVGLTANQDIDGGPATHTFNFPADFNGTPWHVGSTSLRLSQLNYGVTVNGTLPLGTTLQAIQDAVASTVNSTVAQFDAPLQSAFSELGLSVGGADVWATQLETVDASGNPAACGAAPVTTTTTTTPASQAPVLVK